MLKDGGNMLEEYDIKNLNPRKNPYTRREKKQITINLDVSTIAYFNTIAYFKALAKQKGIPYQILINSYLTDCADKKKDLELAWK